MARKRLELSPLEIAKEKVEKLPDWCCLSHNPYGHKRVACSYPAAAVASNFIEWQYMIAYDTFAPEYRNLLADEWRNLFVKPIRLLGPLPGNIFSDESAIDSKLKGQGLDIANMSMREKMEILYGKEYTEAYSNYLNQGLFTWIAEQYSIMRSGLGLTTYEQELETALLERDQATEVKIDK